MANSSDWITSLQDLTPPTKSVSHSWMAALLEPAGFVEGLPITRKHGGQPETLRANGEGSLPASAPPVDPPVDPVADAFARGEAAGTAAAHAENTAAQERQRGLRLTFRNFDQAAMDSLAGELADTVIGLCGQAFAEFVPDPEKLQKRCQDAANRLGAAASECSLHLNPNDVALIGPETLDHWRIVPDEGIERGGLHFESSNGSISDGPPEWRRAIAAAIRG